MKGGAAWNKERTASVMLSKIKEITIYETGTNNDPEFTVRGWFNKENYFSFGSFRTLKEAQDFVERIHDLL